MMGKLNNNTAVEIIPLDESSLEHQNQFRLNSAARFEQRAKMPRMPYISDPTIVPRVQKYLETNVDKTYVDINVMADDLQRMYREYAKRKRNAFRGSVKKAYAIVLQSYGLDEQPISSSEELSDESAEDDIGFRQDNTLNNQLMEIYNRPIRKQPPMEENELIDISSDDSNDQTAMPALSANLKPANGASTSQKNKLAAPPIPPLLNDAELLLRHEMELIKKPENKFTTTYTDRVNNKKRKMENSGKDLPLQSASKKKKSVAVLQEPSVSFKDVGGMNKILEDVCKLLVHIRHPEIYRQIGISAPRGFLLHGPPGCGKTLLAHAIAGELSIPLIKVAAPELVAGISGESEERIRELFERAAFSSPCILFIDEIDAITQNRQNAQKDMERRIVAQLLSCLDDLNKCENADRVLVIGATNRPDTLDPALRRAGRFDREICVGIPDLPSRVHIVKVLTAKLKLEDNFDYETIAKFTPGFVGADMVALTREAAMAAVSRVFNEVKEKRKLEKALALQKATQELLQKQNSVPEPESKPQPEPAESPKAASSEASQEGEKETSEQSNASDTSIVVIDDDVKQAAEKAEQLPPVVPPPPISEEETKKLQKAMELLQPVQTPLEELMSWLHDQVPLTTDQLTGLFITMDDFAKALKVVQPSAKREGFATVPDVTWDNVGSLRNIREELQMAILAPVRHAEQFKSLGLTTPAGVLLCGPPGCGKTLLAKAIANEAGINFLSVKGPELLNMYVGESERAVRLCFERARNSAPCVIFFDELDSLCPKRSDSGEGGATMRVVNQMLTEMDGVEDRQGVFLLAASNRPDIIDPAILRPGRLDKILYVGLPSSEDRVDILRAVTKNGTKPLMALDVNLEAIGKSQQCSGYTGADLAALVREAGVEALKDFMLQVESQKPIMVTTEHFTRAVAKIRPSVSEKDQKHYEKLKKLYSDVKTLLENDIEEMEYS